MWVTLIRFLMSSRAIMVGAGSLFGFLLLGAMTFFMIVVDKIREMKNILHSNKKKML